ncbi:MAG: amidohydrolase [Oligosphaeraceae bacterium]|nr:amidohydrolase [Oligosphaeraceae bacterium]
MIIDSHVHFAAGYEQMPEQGALLVREAGKYGIGAQLVSNVIGGGPGSGPFPTAEYLRRANDYAAEQARKNPGRIYYQVYLNPQLPNWREELARGLAQGAVGIKLWIALKNEQGGLEETGAVLEAAVAARKPVLFHVYNRTDENYPGEIDIAELAWLSRQHPDCRMIAGHLGGNWRESLGMYKYCGANVFFDLCGGYPEDGTLESILQEFPAEKILYGSDARGRSYLSQVQKVSLAKISAEQRELILWRNTARLYGLPEPPPWETPVPGNPLPLPPGADEDHYCFCGRYPFNLAHPEVRPAGLAKMLAEYGLKAAYAADLNGIFSTDLLSSNRQFRQECAAVKTVHPLAVINPHAHNCQAVLEEALTGGYAGVWLSPVRHCWRLDDPRYQFVFQQCAGARLPVYVNFGFDDARFRQAALRTRDCSEEELKNFLAAAPHNRYILQGTRLNPAFQAPPGLNCALTLTHLSDSDGAVAAHCLRPGSLPLCWGSEFPFRDLRQVRAAAAAQLQLNDCR